MGSLPEIDRYQIRRGLGRGAMGSVYLAYDPKVGREVAVKVLEKEFAQNPKHRQRFEREAKSLAALRHENVVEIYDYGGSPDEYLYLVMEFVKGPHIGKIVREHGVLPESVVTAIGMELANALGAAHRAGIIHRDIKPENVFLDDGRLVLADFGIVKAITVENPLGPSAASPQTDIIGTPGFMAPEQLEGAPLDERTDLFAFGALLYYLATKNLPYDADSPYGLLQAFRDTRPPALNKIRPEISESLWRLLEECLAVRPEYRPLSADIVWQRLRDNFEALGAREPRELLAQYQGDPLGFKENDARRVVDHLLGRLKIAVRDQDGITADEIRTRLGVLAPGNDEAMRITGVGKLLSQVRRPTRTGLVAQAQERPWLLAAATVIALGLVAGTIYGINTLPASGPPSRRELAATLRVRASEKTHVYMNGKPLGSTPNFTPASVPPGHAVIEFVSEKRGRLTHETRFELGKVLVLIVDWKARAVREREPKPREERED